MSQAPRDHPATDQELESENLVSAPPVIVTKSQAQGGLVGMLVGGFIGAVLGAIIGAIVFDGALGLIIAIAGAAFGGAVAGGVSGGIAKSSDDDLEGPNADT